jgi:hypothetical protein
MLMRKLSETTVVRPFAAKARFPEIKRLASVSAGILFSALLHAPGEAVAQTVPASYSVALGWVASPSTDVTGYRVYYGTASGNYTASISLGTVTAATVPGLAAGVTYFFAVTAFNASGLESDLSNQMSFQPGLQGTSIGSAANGEMVLTMKGLIGQQYDIEASQDLKTWAIISKVTLGSNGSMEFSDPDAADFPERFYRIRVSP